ncbi:MAG: MFS transporter, partial [Pseudolabrys sp.]
MDTKQRFSNIFLLFVARALRGFGDGFAIIVLPAYLSAIGFDPAEIGLVAAAALLGTAVFTLGVGFVAPRYDLRNLLIAGAALMICTGLAFAQATVIWIVIAVAFFGTINPSTGDIGALIPLEHAMLTYGVGNERRTHVFARYSLIGALSMAVGALAAAAPDLLAATGMERNAAFKLMFYAYAVLGLACAAIY